MKITIDGSAEIALNKIRCVCGHCNHHDNENAIIEFNFKEQKVLYLCSSCKKMNELQFGKEMFSPYPRIGVGR